MAKKKVLTWLEFLAIENRLRALMHMCQTWIPETKVTIYSLSDNTLWKHWVKKDPDGAVEDYLFQDNDLMLSSEIKLKGVAHDGNYVRLEIFSNGEIGCTAYLGFKDEDLKTPALKLLNEARELENMVPYQEYKDVFNMVREVFKVLHEFVHDPVNKFNTEFEDEDVAGLIKKYLIGEKKN